MPPTVQKYKGAVARFLAWLAAARGRPADSDAELDVQVCEYLGFLWDTGVDVNVHAFSFPIGSYFFSERPTKPSRSGPQRRALSQT